MIYIHPTATHNMNSLVALKQATGLTITRGQRYLCLVPGETDSAPQAQTEVTAPRRPGKTSRVTSYLQDPRPLGWPTPDGPFHPGGGSAA